MIKEVKKERTAACAYYLSGLDPVDGKKMPISIEKRGDRITIILKGNVHVKNLQQEIINEILRPQKDKVIKKLFNDVYEVIFKENLFSGIDDIMSQIRERNIITHHAYKPQGGEVTLYNLTDKVMIKLVGNPGKDQIKKLLAKYALRRRYTSVSLNNSGSTIIVEVTSQSGADNASGINPPKGKNPLKIANLLEKEKIVDTAEVSLIYRLPNFLEKKMPGKKEKEENINIIKKEKGIDIAVESNGKKKNKK